MQNQCHVYADVATIRNSKLLVKFCSSPVLRDPRKLPTTGFSTNFLQEHDGLQQKLEGLTQSLNEEQKKFEELVNKTQKLESALSEKTEESEEISKQLNSEVESLR